MPKRALLLPSAAILLAGAGLLTLNSLGPLQLPTVLVYSGLVILLFGLACLVWPPKPLGITRRSQAAVAVLAGAVTLAAGLLWPASTRQSAGGSRLDAYLPAYDFHEVHELRVRASPPRVAEAMRQVSFADIGVMQTLGRVRAAVMGAPSAEVRPAPPKPILELVSSGESGFFPLEDAGNEFIFGMAGQPWNNGARAVHLKPESFASWMLPGNVKIATNLLVQDAGNGWSLIRTETRVLATDAASRRTMARYWRFIYPGSGMIRQSLLGAIRNRAEKAL